MKKAAAALALGGLLAGPAHAQVDIGAGIGPDAFATGDDRRKRELPSGPTPVGLAASLAFDATTWAAVEVSTTAAKELSTLLRRGYYRLEVLQVVLMARKAGVSLRAVVAARDKGESLRQIAKGKDLDYDALYEESLVLDSKVGGELLQSIMSVSVSTTAPPAPEDPRRRRKP